LILIDANIFLAFENKDDIFHKNAITLFQTIETEEFGKYFTTDYIFNEVIGVINRKYGKERAVLFGSHILETVYIHIIDEHLLEEAWKVFSTTTLRLSLVDCTNLVALKLANTKYIATFDKEFLKVKGIIIIS